MPVGVEPYRARSRQPHCSDGLRTPAVSATRTKTKEYVMKLRIASLATAAVIATSVPLADSAQAAWRGGWGWAGVGFGLAAGALIGSALAAPYYYPYGGYYPHFRHRYAYSPPYFNHRQPPPLYGFTPSLYAHAHYFPARGRCSLHR